MPVHHEDGGAWRGTALAYNRRDGFANFPPMADRLFLRLAPDGSLSWLRASTDPHAAVAQAGAPPPAILAQAREVVVLVPASDVLVTRVNLSARNRAQLLKAVPYAIEDSLLAPVESLHFAVAATREAEVGVAVVARTTLQGWLDRLAADGIQADIVLPQSLALPWTQEQACALIDETGACVRLGAWSGFACGADELEAWLAQVTPAPALEVHDFRAAAAQSRPEPMTHTLERPRDGLAFLAAHWTSPPLNLLDGEFASHRRRRHDGARRWRLAAALAAGVIGLALLDQGAQVWRLSRTSAQLDADARATMQRAFPDLDARLFDRLTPAQLLRSRSARGSDAGSQGVIGVLERIGPILTGGSRQIQMRAFDYRHGVFELALRAPDLNALDLLREHIAQVPGYKAELTAANPGADGVDGRIRIDTGAAAGKGAGR